MLAKSGQSVPTNFGAGINSADRFPPADKICRPPPSAAVRRFAVASQGFSSELIEAVRVAWGQLEHAPLLESPGEVQQGARVTFGSNRAASPSRVPMTSLEV